MDEKDSDESTSWKLTKLPEIIVTDLIQSIFSDVNAFWKGYCVYMQVSMDNEIFKEI